MEEFAWFAGIVLVIVVLVAAWPLILFLAIAAPCCYFGYTAYKEHEAAEAAKRIAEAERRRQMDAQWEDTKRSVSSEISNKLSRIDMSSIRATKNYFNRLDPNSKEHAIQVARGRVAAIEELLSELLVNNRVGDAKETVDFLLVLDRNNREYQRILSSISMEKILNADSVYIGSTTYGAVNQAMLNNLKQLNSTTVGNITDVDIRYTLWSYTLLEPFDKHGYKTTASMFSGQGDSSCPQIDYAASLIYLEAKYGNMAVKEAAPDYKEHLSRLNSCRSTTAIASLASIAAWCGNTERERAMQKLMQSNREQPWVSSTNETAKSNRVFA